MFVRWKKRKCTGRHRSEFINYNLDAVLVENYREDGKVKQRFIKHLGSFGDNGSPHEKGYFWDQVTKRLDNMNLDEPERSKIEQSILKRVPKLTKEERYKQTEEWSKQLEQDRINRL